MRASEKGSELRRRETGLSEHLAEGAGRKLPMHRHDDRSIATSELDMAASLAHLHETSLGQSGDDVGATDDRQCRAHADSWTVAMMGGSTTSGMVSSSKYSSSASRKFAKASSTVRPWLVTSTSKARATYHPPSCVTAAVNCTRTTLRHGGSRRGTFAVAKALVADVAPLASQNTNLAPVVEGPAISLTALHAKVRREGYVK